MNYKDTDINGNTWCKPWVDTYNRLTALIECTRCDELRERYKDERHKHYVLCMTIAMEG
jgi:hypothetical protein